MIQIIVVSHGKLADGLLDSVEMICGKQDMLYKVSLKNGDDPLALTENISKLVNANDEDTLILADLFGGSPCNAAAALLKNDKIQLVSGVNLPMLIQVLQSRNTQTLNELTDTAIQTVKDTSINVRALMER